LYQRSGRLGLQPAGVCPQPLQVVVAAGGGIEKVDDNIAVVQQHPLAVLVTLFSQRAPIGGLELVDHLFGKRQHMAPRGSGGNDEDIGNDQQPGNIEQGDLQALLVLDGRGRTFGGCDGLFVDGDWRLPLPTRDV